ncbi:MAG: hypothetical protein KC561_16160 [Myxococcales bacterium]|nr:hypothetical protein [Myxococcales bacterium]
MSFCFTEDQVIEAARWAYRELEQFNREEFAKAECGSPIGWASAETEREFLSYFLNQRLSDHGDFPAKLILSA